MMDGIAGHHSALNRYMQPQLLLSRECRPLCTCVPACTILHLVCVPSPVSSMQKVVPIGLCNHVRVASLFF